MFDCRIEKGFNPITIRIDCIEDLKDLINVLQEHYHEIKESSDNYPKNIIELGVCLAKIYNDQERKGNEMLRNDLKIVKDRIGKSSNSDLLKFTVQIIEDEITDQIYSEHDKVQKGVKFLKEHNQWSTLLRIAKEAVEDCIEIIREDKSLLKSNILSIITFKKDILNMGKAEFWDLLSDKAKEKYFGED